MSYLRNFGLNIIVIFDISIFELVKSSVQR